MNVHLLKMVNLSERGEKSSRGAVHNVAYLLVKCFGIALKKLTPFEILSDS